MAGGFRRCSRMVVASAPMRALTRRVAQVATSDAPVIIRGECGSGKEVLARTLHANGPRRGRPLLVANVGARPADLVEAELFGHARGGAGRTGLFEAAEGGILYLEDVAEMPLALQGALARVLEEGEIRRVGDGRPTKVDVRIVCGTTQDLEACAAERRFRPDLYYRLRVFTLAMPPLRARKEDVLPLARMFLGQEGHPTGRFTRAAEEALLRHRWPGNVRELANAVTHAAAFSSGADVEVAHLPDEVARPRARATGPAALRPLADVEREHVHRVLASCGGRLGDAARILGIGRTTLWRKLRTLGIEEDAERDGGGTVPRAQYRKVIST